MSAAVNNALAPKEWMNRRSSPATLTIMVWLVSAPALVCSASMSTPCSRSISPTTRPNTSLPTRPATLARTPMRVRSTATFAAQPPMVSRKRSVSTSSPAAGTCVIGLQTWSATTMPAQGHRWE
jgi:hypothetical protein